MNDSGKQRLECDLVMRGGITSGIVYPLAVAELSDTYDFRSIGGTSAGAIAAVVTAAAAYGKLKGDKKAFDAVAAIPCELGKKTGRGTFMENLFQPQASTARLFGVVKSAIAAAPQESPSGRLLAVTQSLLRLYFWNALPGAVPGLLVVAGSMVLSAEAPALQELTAVVVMVVGVVAAALGHAAVALYCLYQDAVSSLHENMYGLCSGMPERAGPEQPTLTPWLHGLIQKVAGRTAAGTPLTIGELKDPFCKAKRPGEAFDKDHGIELQLMTTNITLGQPRMFPHLEVQGDEIYFNVAELRRLLPAGVVDHMVDKGRGRGMVPADTPANRDPRLCRLPEARDLPVLFGARLSLSFPILLSAIPLYHRDLSGNGAEGPPRFHCCWYTDGGLTSNFPVHMFDSPIPMRPTFGINLAPATVSHDSDPKENDKWQHISMPEANEQSSQVGFNLFGQRGRSESAEDRYSSITGFVSALLDTARNWQDSRLMAMPGYRDRIVTVHLVDGKEGGYRLDMEKETIESVAQRGRLAAELLIARFSGMVKADPRSGGPITLDWENHRRVRLRASLAALEHYARDFAERWDRDPVPPPASTCYRQVAQDHFCASYPFGDKERTDEVFEAACRLVAAIKSLPGQAVFDNPLGSPDSGRAPRPKAELKLRPPDS